MILLDTHVLIWFVTNNSALKPRAREAIEAAEQAGELYLCPMSLWEITFKEPKGQLNFGIPVRSWLERAIKSTGLHLTELDVAVACECALLPPEFHGDPADRLIAATARVKGLTLITHDGTLLRLAKKGFLKVIAT